MLVKLTIDGGTERVTEQARPEILDDRLRMLHNYDPAAEQRAREAIRTHIRNDRQFTAAQIACTGRGDEWHPEFEVLYDALAHEYPNPQEAHDEAGKFLGLLVWNEALNDQESWHFTAYPKQDSELMVTHYFSVDAHIRAEAKSSQAANARAHGDDERADSLEEAATSLRNKWGGRR